MRIAKQYLAAVRRRPVPFAVGAAAVILLSAIVIVALWPRDDGDVYVELGDRDGVIDFADPELQPHTAEDGIAVVRPQKREQGAQDAGQFAEIWADDESVTHGGFTLPVPMEDGESIGVLTIPDIGVAALVYEAEDEMEAMEKGVAHFKSTSSWEGNIGFSAHNINFDGSAGYFRDLYLLQPGAVIVYESALGTRNYLVQSITEIEETDWSSLARSSDNRLTLITCISGKRSLRLCVVAVESV